MAKEVQSPENYLLARGWTRLAPEHSPAPKRIWRDPASQGKPEVREVGKTGGHVKRPVLQTFHPTAPWCYTTRAAQDIQRERDGLPALERD